MNISDGEAGVSTCCELPQSKTTCRVLALVMGLLPQKGMLAQCNNPGDPNVAAAKLGIVDGNGIRVIHIGFVQDFHENIRTAVQHAMDQWNGKTDTTHVRFTMDGTPDVKINLDGQRSTCGGYRSASSPPQFIDLSSYLVDALTPGVNGHPTATEAAARIDKARYPLAHELGHTFNLGESSDQSSIMSVPDYVQCNATTLDGFPLKGVSDNDATAAKNCVGQVIEQGAVFEGDGSLDHSETRYDCECECWTQYQVIVGWKYSTEYDGYEVDELNRYELASGCGPPPDM